MIPIKHPNMKQLVLNHLEKIKKELEDDGNLEMLLSVINERTKSGKRYTINEIICSNTEELKRITNDVEIREELLLSFMLKLYKRFAARKGRKKYSAIEFVDNLGITVCPYCNRTYIQTAKRDNKKAFRTCQLDHFFSKDKYPYLALSFFNLVPSCYACNHVKSNKDENLLSPYESFRTDDLLNFKWSPGDSSFRYSKGRIDLKPSFTSQGRFSLQKNFEVFGLEDLYKKHKDVVQEILMKGEIYSNEYIKSLVAQFPDLITSEEEAMRLVTGNYVLEEDFGKRPLAKLTRDIAKNAGLI